MDCIYTAPFHPNGERVQHRTPSILTPLSSKKEKLPPEKQLVKVKKRRKTQEQSNRGGIALAGWTDKITVCSNYNDNISDTYTKCTF